MFWSNNSNTFNNQQTRYYSCIINNQIPKSVNPMKQTNIEKDKKKKKYNLWRK